MLGSCMRKPMAIMRRQWVLCLTMLLLPLLRACQASRASVSSSITRLLQHTQQQRGRVRRSAQTALRQAAVVPGAARLQVCLLLLLLRQQLRVDAKMSFMGRLLTWIQRCSIIPVMSL